MTNFRIRFIDNNNNDGLIHKAYELDSKNISSYALYEHLLCRDTCVSVNLSIDKLTEIIHKMLYRYFGKASEVTYSKNIAKLLYDDNDITVYIITSEIEKIPNQSFGNFNKAFYKMINTIL